jgi:Ca2+-binding EF-hand superfamily protein
MFSVGDSLVSERARLVHKHLSYLATICLYTVDELRTWLDKFKHLAGAEARLSRPAFDALLTAQFGFRRPLLRWLFAAFDVDKDGVLSFDEFVVHMSILEKGTPEDRLRLLFHCFDTDRSGTLGATEVENILRVVETDGNRAIARARFERELVRALPRLQGQYEITGRLQDDVSITANEFIGMCATQSIFVRLYGMMRDACIGTTTVDGVAGGSSRKS